VAAQPPEGAPKLAGAEQQKLASRRPLTEPLVRFKLTIELEFRGRKVKTAGR
jgi:hypothetical protein